MVGVDERIFRIVVGYYQEVGVVEEEQVRTKFLSLVSSSTALLSLTLFDPA